MRPGILERWEVTPEELTTLVDQNPSLRGILLGYVAEPKLREMLLSDPRVDGVRKPDDHDRIGKGDFIINYEDHPFRIESKSLQTKSVKRRSDGTTFLGQVQCDASDRRNVTLPDGTTLSTTCLLVGEFDVLACNLFAFEENWRFSFALNRDLPRSKYVRYTDDQKRHLLATLIPVTWPPEPPFVADLFSLLDRLVAERQR